MTGDTEQRADQAIRVQGGAADLLGMLPDEVVLAPPHTVLKTSSGKIRRAAVRELFETGQTGRQPRAAWWQIVHLTLALPFMGEGMLSRMSRTHVHVSRVLSSLWRSVARASAEVIRK